MESLIDSASFLWSSCEPITDSARDSNISDFGSPRGKSCDWEEFNYMRHNNALDSGEFAGVGARDALLYGLDTTMPRLVKCFCFFS